jgi:hypothetical protein
LLGNAHAFVLRYADEYKRPAMTLLPDAPKRAPS